MVNCRKKYLGVGPDAREAVARPSGAVRLGQFAAILLAVVLAGCSVAKRDAYDVPEVPLPAKFKNAQPSPPDLPLAPDPAVDSSAVEDSSLIEWWRSFGNRELEALIDRGLANNPDVRIATLRVAQAKVRADQARAGKAPTISAPAMVGNGSVPVGTGVSASQRVIQASIKGEWRLDVWGEQSSLAESANLQVWRAAFERDNVQRNMAATLASNYVEYISLNDRLKVARETEAVLTATMSTIEKRVEAGDATLTELEQQRASIYALRATIPNLEQQREDSINAIAFLVGTLPSSLKLSANGLDSLVLPEVLPGLPAALLLRRPDVRMVEARLLAADADIDVARARILPPVDLSAQAGYSSLFLAQLFQPKALFWNALASLTGSIFDGGRRASEKEFSQAMHEEMVETYVRTIYQAMREVEGALGSIRLAGKRLDAQQEAASAARRAWDISTQVYAVGGVDYLTLLDTERTYHRYLDEFQRIRMDHYRGYINLFQAIGGGVKPAERIPGKGSRPAAVASGKISPAIAQGSPVRAFSAEGVDWEVGRLTAAGSSWQIENFWQVELPGLYHRTTIGAAWRDLRARFPQYMESRMLRPRLNGRIDDSVDGQESWYRLYVAKFSSVLEAEEFCAALQAWQQRCRIVSSRSDETVPPSGKAVASVSYATAANSVGAAQETTDAAKDALAPALASANPALPATAKEPSRQAALVESVRDKVAYTVQLGAFANLENAAIARGYWQQKGYPAYVAEIRDSGRRTLFAVRTGGFEQRRDASAMALAIRRKEDAPAIMLPTMVDQRGNPAMIDEGDLPPAASAPVAPVVPEPPETSVAQPVVEETLPKPLGEKAAAERRPAYAVQLGAFSSRENAVVSFDFWRAKGYEAYVCEIRDADGRTWYAVRSGAFLQRRKAADLARALGSMEDAPAAVVPTTVDPLGKPDFIDPADLAESAASPRVAGDEKAGEASDGRTGPRKKPTFAVQLGAFVSLDNAAKSLGLWQGKGYEAYVCEITYSSGRNWYAVRIGEFVQRPEATSLLRTLGRTEDIRPALVPAVLNRDGNLARIDVNHLLEVRN